MYFYFSCEMSIWFYNFNFNKKTIARLVTDSEVGEVMSLVGSVDDIWSEVVLSGRENA